MTTKFRFIESSHFSLTDLEITNEATVDTVSSLSSIATSAELTEEIEMTIQLILGLVAHETDNHQVAAATLEKVIEERGGVAANPKWGLIQADSYIKTGQEERAIEVYREMLKTDSTNVKALLRCLTIRSTRALPLRVSFNICFDLPKPQNRRNQ